ncbi:MAG TPA: cation:dicarboxylase symporter family transporter, partial [Phycisphaerales bacterium]|nr:cation:dicarboxylase symporter family transporter [Phycisphaerales bacterium]
MGKSAAITVLMILGLVAGALAGEYLRANAVEPIGPDHWTKFVGTLVVIRPLMLMIIPLVFVSVTLGVTSVGNPAKLGLLGGSTL